jgi:hypothetical protein
VKRFFVRFFSFAGLYLMVGSCPCCGSVGCPASAGIVGLIMSIGPLLRHPLQQTRRLLTSIVTKTSGGGTISPGFFVPGARCTAPTNGSGSAREAELDS